MGLGFHYQEKIIRKNSHHGSIGLQNFVSIGEKHWSFHKSSDNWLTSSKTFFQKAYEFGLKIQKFSCKIPPQDEGTFWTFSPDFRKQPYYFASIVSKNKGYLCWKLDKLVLIYDSFFQSHQKRNLWCFMKSK